MRKVSAVPALHCDANRAAATMLPCASTATVTPAIEFAMDTSAPPGRLLVPLVALLRKITARERRRMSEQAQMPQQTAATKGGGK